MIGFKKTYIFIFLLLLTACGIIKEKNNYVKTELYFGLSDNNINITQKQWKSFRMDVLDVFLNGYTEVDCKGYWVNENENSVSEDCKIIVYLNKYSTLERNKINSVIKKYKKRFNQESVLLINYEVHGEF